MRNIKRKTLSVLLIISLFIGMVGVVNVNISYAATKKIHIKKKTVTIVAGKTYQQKLISKKGKTIKATKVKWKSSNKKIAKINKKGKITAVKKDTVKMTAKYKGKTYKFTVKVKKSNTYTSSDLRNIKTDMKCAQNYSDNMKADVADWVYLNFNYNYSTNSPQDSLDALNLDFEGAIKWLSAARNITSARSTRNCRTKAALNAGFKTWNGMLNSLILECNALMTENVFYYTESEALDYQNRIGELVKGIQIANKEISAW